MIENITDIRNRIKELLDDCYKFRVLYAIEFILKNNVEKDAENHD